MTQLYHMIVIIYFVTNSSQTIKQLQPNTCAIVCVQKAIVHSRSQKKIENYGTSNVQNITSKKNVKKDESSVNEDKKKSASTLQNGTITRKKLNR